MIKKLYQKHRKVSYWTWTKVSQYELTKRFSSLEPRKAVGRDEFNPCALKEYSKSIALPLQFIFKKSYTEMKLPKIWKRANVTSLLKSESKLNVKNYRPVSLTCIPGKCLERVIRDEMVEYLVENYLICKEQHGFMPFKSCVTNRMKSLEINTSTLKFWVLWKIKETRPDHTWAAKKTWRFDSNL